MPVEIVDFLAKYFASDNIAWPEQYLWKVEREQEFNDLGLTRRMTFIMYDAEDLEEGEEEDILMKLERTDTQRVKMLLLNFLVGRILINHVIVRQKIVLQWAFQKQRLIHRQPMGNVLKKFTFIGIATINYF